MSLIRTTWNSRLSSLSSVSSRLASRLGQAQDIAATGAKVSRPSDAPSDIGRIHALNAQRDRQDTFTDNATFADSVLAVADGALGSMSDALAQARELAVAMASGTRNDEQRQQAASKAQGIFDRLVDLANTDLGGRYVFAGRAYDTIPYQDDGTYGGSGDQPTAPVSNAVDVPMGYDGSDLLQGTTDIFGAVDTLVTALEGGDADTVAASLDALTAATEQVSAARSQVGNDMSLSLDVQELNENLQTELTRQISSLTDADAVESYTRLYELQTTYEAALQVTAYSKSSNLFSMM